MYKQFSFSIAMHVHMHGTDFPFINFMQLFICGLSNLLMLAKNKDS